MRPTTLLKKRLAQVFSCEFCEISKNTFSYRTPPVPASETSRNKPHFASIDLVITHYKANKLQKRTLRQSTSFGE